MINYYEVMEVSEKASKGVIEKAYKALAKKYHPDLNHNNPKEAEAKMKELNEAFSVLTDDAKRENFDRILNKKRELEMRKNSYTVNQQSTPTSGQTTNQFSNSSYANSNGNFVVNTSNMDEKTKKKLQAKMQERYLEAYDAYLRERGYKLAYKWSFKRIMQTVAAVILTILILVILFFIPPIHELCINLYETNSAVKIIVDLISSLFRAFMSAFQ